MNAYEVSARFAAFVWYEERKTGAPAPEGEAARFARANWRAFRGCAHEGLGRLLIRIASGKRGGRGRRRGLAPAAAAG